MLSIFVFLFSCITLSLSAWFTASRVYRYQLLPGALLYLFLFLVQVTAIELTLGIANILNPFTILISSIFTSSIVFVASRNFLHSRFKTRQTDASLLSASTLNQRVELSRSGIFALTAISLIILIPFYSLISELLIQVFRVHPLSWDVVSYHLPNVLSYLQAGSLWADQGTYNYYPGGNELLQLWSFLPLKSDAILGITTVTLGLGGLLAATVLLSSVLPRKNPFELSLWRLALWIGCLSVPVFQEILFDFGRNDITLMFWLLMAVWCLQQAAQAGNRKWRLLGTGISLGLAIGTKPNGLYYLIGFLCLFFADFFPANSSHHPRVSKLFESIKFILLPATLLGGFWYIRNLIRTGEVSPRELLDAATDLSIFKNLFNPALYEFNFPLFFFLLSLGITTFTVILCTLKPLQYSVNLKLISGLNAIAIVALIFTPSGAGYLIGGGKLFLIQVRYSAVMIPITIILILFHLSQLFDRYLANNEDLRSRLDSLFSNLHHSAKPQSTALFLSIINGIGLFLLITQLVTYQAPIGLPGHDGIFFPVGNRPSQVYAWVQKNLSNTVIYSIGLRPYGLYGFPFTNRVIYELGSSNWRYQNGLETIRTHKPKYLAISLDPFTRTAPAEIQSLTNQPKAFEVVYQDPLALVFQITELGQALADRF